MTDNVIKFSTLLNEDTSITVEDVLKEGMKKDLECVFVIGYRKGDGLMVTGSSDMTNQDALWMLMKAREYILDTDRYEDD